MTAEQCVAFFLFSLVAAITPGPSNVMLTATGAAVGVVRGLPCLAGVALGMAVLIFGMAVGVGQIAIGHPLVLKALNWLGAAFLLWLSWKIATAKPSAAAGVAKPVGFLGAAAFQWVNPKSWLVSSSAAGTYLQAGADSPLLQATLFTALFIAAMAPSGLAWLVFGASMQRYLGNPRAARIFNIVMGGSLAVSVTLILT